MTELVLATQWMLGKGGVDDDEDDDMTPVGHMVAPLSMGRPHRVKKWPEEGGGQVGWYPPSVTTSTQKTGSLIEGRGENQGHHCLVGFSLVVALSRFRAGLEKIRLADVL